MKVSAGGLSVEVAASIGVITSDELRSASEEDLLAAADRAMYRVKSRRRGA